MWRRIVWYKLANVSEQSASYIFEVEKYLTTKIISRRESRTLRIGTACSSQTSVNFYQATPRHIPEDFLILIVIMRVRF
jgi:hypothetical protein